MLQIRTPKQIFDAFRLSRKRAAFNQLLSQIVAKHSLDLVPHSKVLIDAAFNNPNFWLRTCLIRAALGGRKLREIGVIGQWQRKEQSETLQALGIQDIRDLLNKKYLSRRYQTHREEYLGRVSSPKQILDSKLPYDIPSSMLYDYILKVQRLASVDCTLPSFSQSVTEFFKQIEISESLLEEVSPDILLSSHVIGVWTPLVWVAMKENRVIIPFGDAGICRFWSLKEGEDLYDSIDRPHYEDYLQLNDKQKTNFITAGKKALQFRTQGASTNMGAIYAYQRRSESFNRESICKRFGWDPKKKIIGVYASNWFDYPHSLGMSYFEDFRDWIFSTIETIRSVDSVHWLMKGHPCDEWYGGLTLEDLVRSKTSAHIQLADRSWNGYSMLHSLDGFITYHGTIGLEAASLKKPVMVADRGWYHDWNFAVFPKSRHEYLDLLKKDWWNRLNPDQSQEEALCFAGWYWGSPDRQGNFRFEDDSTQWKIYDWATPHLADRDSFFQKEIRTIRNWFDEGRGMHYHTYKMTQSEPFLGDF